MTEVCRVCSREVRTMAFKGTGLCCGNCLKADAKAQGLNGFASKGGLPTTFEVTIIPPRSLHLPWVQ